MVPRMRRIRTLPALPVVAALAATPACFVFDRLEGVEPGTIVGRAVNLDGTAVSWSKVRIDSAGVVRRADEGGGFRVKGLPEGGWVLRLSSDETGDGVPEQATLRAVALAETVLDGARAIPSVLLGDVRMEGTAVLVGRVVDDADAPAAGCKVAVWRNAAALKEAGVVVEAGGAILAPVDLGVEGTTGTDDGGRFRVPGVTHGDVLVGAFCPDGRATAPAAAHAIAGPDVDAGDLPLLPPGVRPAQIRSTPALPDDAELRVDFVVPGGDRTDPADVAATILRDAGREIAVDAPTGLWDVHVTALEDGVETRHGVLVERAVAPGTDPLLWGDVLLEEEDPCFPDRPDQDRDGLPGMPRDGTTTIAQACYAACAAASHEDGAPTTCVVDDQTFDCDDDEDGQPDLHEPPACLGLCAGADLDHDGLCDPSDPFPWCAENDPAAEACGADAEPVDPGDPGDPCAFSTPPTCDPAAQVSVFCQAHVDLLEGCTELDYLAIYGEDVVSLAPLSSMTRIASLSITSTSITNLEGLGALTSADYVGLHGNARLETLDGLGAATIGNLSLFDAPALVDVTGLGDAAALAASSSWTFQDLPSVATAVPNLTSIYSLYASGTLGNRSVLFADLASTEYLSIYGLVGSTLPTFSSLTTAGVVSIDGNQDIVDLSGLEALRSVAHLAISYNDALTSLDGLDSLEEATSVLSIAGNDALTTLGTFPLLTTIGSFSVQSAAALVDLGAFPALTSLDSIYFSSVPSLERLADLPPTLTRLGGAVYLQDLPALLQPYGLEDVVDVGGSVSALNTGMTSLAPLANLRTVGGAIHLSDNAALADASGLAGLTSVYSIEIARSPALTALPAFPSLTTLYTLHLEDLGGLVDIGSYPSVTALSTLLVLRAPQAAQGGDFTQLTAVYWIELEDTGFVAPTPASAATSLTVLRLRNNAAMTSLNGLEQVQSVTSEVTIVGNVALDQCAATTFAQTKTASTGAAVTVQGNANEALCPALP